MPSWCARPTCTRSRIAAAVRAVGRAGAGVNNIPVAELSKRGIPVFNAPGANANAVKELVLAGLLLAARNICPGLALRARLAGRRCGDRGGGREAARRQFVGFELPGPHARRGGPRRHRRRGRQLRAGARHEGARLRPADHRAARLAAVRRASSRRCRSMTCSRAPMRSRVHVPLNDATRDLVNAARLKLMKQGGDAPQLRARRHRRRGRRARRARRRAACTPTCATSRPRASRTTRRW